MNAMAVREALFGDVLVCDEMRPAAFLPGIPDSTTMHTLATRGEALLRALAIVEDGVRNEEPEQPADYALHRIEAKLDLLTVLVAGLAPTANEDPLRPLQWSARGASLVIDQPLPIGSSGCFRVKPTDWLPSPLVLPATVVACDTDSHGNQHAWLRFGPMTPALEAALERHLFRVHRRSVAESRRPR